MQDLSYAAWASSSGSVRTSTSKPNMAKPPEQVHSLSLTEKSWTKDSAAAYAKSLEQPGALDDANRVRLVKRNTALPPKPSQDPEATDYKPGVSSQLPKGKAIELALKRLWPPVLYLHSSSETPYLLKETSKGGSQGEDRNLLYYSKLGVVVPSGGPASANQSIDRSGPLVKSLLRRSLSMDSQVPVYSPSTDLKLSQEPPTAANEALGIVFRAMSQKSFLKDCSEKKALDYRPHRLRSFSASQSTDREEASPVTEVRIKTKPSSSLSAPSDIIQGTVGAAAAMRDLPLKTEKDQRDISRLPAKKRFQTDRRPPLKKAKANEHGPAISEENCEEGRSAPSSDSNFPDHDLNREKFEQGLCWNTTVCPYRSPRFSALKQEQEDRCEYKKLTCMQCMRAFKSSFSIWRHQVEAHNYNNMALAENFTLPTLNHNGEVVAASRPHTEPSKVNHVATAKEDTAFSDSSEQVNFNSEDSSCIPEDLSPSKRLKVQVKEESVEEAKEQAPEARAVPSKEARLWPCEKCGKKLRAYKQLERHQELQCSVKSFICQVCHKAFRTNFRLWSHFHTHMSPAPEEPVNKKSEVCPVPTNSPSPPPPSPLPKIQPPELCSPTGLSENPTPATEKLFAPQESDNHFYHAPSLSAITCQRQFMCKLCHRIFKTAFSLWSHEKTHNQMIYSFHLSQSSRPLACKLCPKTEYLKK